MPGGNRRPERVTTTERALGSSESDNLTLLLNRGSAGDRDAADQAFEQVYTRLKAIAGGSGTGVTEDQTLHPTALVHEAYGRLFSTPASGWNDRRHFFAVAAKAMRHIIIDHARASLASKRRGDWKRVDGGELTGASPLDPISLIMLDDALTELAELSPRQARVIELRFFAGLSVSEVAAVIGMSDRTVELDWRTARAWLRERLGSE